jgi:hypothetical protein
MNKNKIPILASTVFDSLQSQAKHKAKKSLAISGSFESQILSGAM